MGDECKNYIFHVTKGFFGVDASTLKPHVKNKCISAFLDDPNVNALFVLPMDKAIIFTNSSKPENVDQLIFSKTRPVPITKDNISESLFISSVRLSASTSLYRTIQDVYTPMLKTGDHEKQPENLKIMELAHNFADDLERTINSNASERYSMVMTPMDEINHWKTKKENGDERGRIYYECLTEVEKFLEGTKPDTLEAYTEFINLLISSYEQLWEADEFDPLFPEDRMRHLMYVNGLFIVKKTQNELKSLDIWNKKFSLIKDQISTSIHLISHYMSEIKMLIDNEFRRNPSHKWEDEMVEMKFFKDYRSRLIAIRDIRSKHSEISSLINDNKSNDDDVFESFRHIDSLHTFYDQEESWNKAVGKFDKKIEGNDREVADILRRNFANVNDNPYQLIREYTKYKDIISRDNIKKSLAVELEGLIGQMEIQVKQMKDEFNSNKNRVPPKGRNLPQIVNEILFAKQLEAKITEYVILAKDIINKSPKFKTFQRIADSTITDISSWRKDRYERWVSDTEMAIDQKDRDIVLDINGKITELDAKDGNLVVLYGDRLVTLIREVRQLSALGYQIPQKIIVCYQKGQDYYKHGIILKQLAQFYNTIDQEMLPCQQALLLKDALEFEKIVKAKQSEKKSSSISWNSPTELSDFISRLKNSAEKLRSDNRKLRKYHFEICDIVLQLFDTSLLKEKEKWKEAQSNIRSKMNNVLQQGFPEKDMIPWRIHWNHQLYKVLEFQYSAGLLKLNEHLPDISTSLNYNNSKIEFRPPLEEVQTKYYEEMKKFMIIPMLFKGVSDIKEHSSIFSTIADEHVEDVKNCFEKADKLFEQVLAEASKFKDYISIVDIDISEVIRVNFTDLKQWERNFRELKIRARNAEKLPNDVRVDCIVISTTPIKRLIETVIQQIFDSMVEELRSRIAMDLAQVKKFLVDAKELKAKVPQDHKQVAEVYKRQNELKEKKLELAPKLKDTEGKNRLLRNVAGGSASEFVELTRDMDEFDADMDEHEQKMTSQIESLKKKTLDRVREFENGMAGKLTRWENIAPKSQDMEDPAKFDRTLANAKKEIEEFERVKEELNPLLEAMKDFKMSRPILTNYDKLEATIGKFNKQWGMLDKFRKDLAELGKNDWISFRTKLYKFEEFLSNQAGELQSSLEGHKPTDVHIKLRKEIDTYRNMVPSLKYIRGDSFSDEHWWELFRIINMPKKNVTDLVFGDFIKCRDSIIMNMDRLKELNGRAQGEVVIREALGELDAWGASTVFATSEYTDINNGKLNIIKEWRELLAQVGDNQSLLGSLKDSPYYKMFEDRASIWEQKLGDLDKVLNSLNLIQRKWVYLEPIFGRGALPEQQMRFRSVDKDFRGVMEEINKDNLVINILHRKDLKAVLKTDLEQLGRCQKALNEFMEEKRGIFPRFYFIGDDDLLEILGQSTNPTVIQSHLKKLFGGIHSVEFDNSNKNILAMKSLEGEVVPLMNPVKIVPNVEVWLNDLSNEMQKTLASLLVVYCSAMMKEDDVSPNLVAKYPSQILSTGEFIYFSTQVEKQLSSSGNMSSLSKLLSTRLEKLTNITMDLKSAAGRVMELKVKSLIFDIIHNRDIIEQLMKENINSSTDWCWQRQLRFYLNKEKKCVIRMVDAEFDYTYEYQGNASKLVHTPLTDKCYLTLTQGMHLGFGGNPYGPAGTGKTESVKALGNLFARQVLVFNCDEGIDEKSMGRIFVGLCKCGAWGCFDEFNRLEEAVLSAVSTQIQAIQNSIKMKEKTTKLLERDIDINHNSGIFVTMNPAGKGYGGRSKLPDNLKQLFRPVAMSRPDNELIAEVILYSEGFKEAKNYGKKLVTVFNLSKELLSVQLHYDWGLRSLKTILRGCGDLLKKAKNSDNEVNKNEEAKLIVQSTRINTLSKLTISDSKRFDTLLQDVFTDVELKDIEYDELKKKLAETYEKANLKVNGIQLRKSLELYEQIRQRMGVVIVGPSGSGKSTQWRMLKKALKQMGKKIITHVCNPKSLPRQQLLGSIDIDTREWTDGVLTSASRKVVKEPLDVQSWIVCDGDIDPEWIESLNSVLDDNRLLTMPSGERIQFGPNVNFIFETHDLSFASPATISRMGMIFLSEEDVEVESLVNRWSLTLDEEKKDIIMKLIQQYFYKALQLVMKKGNFVVKTSYVGTINNGLSHLRKADTKEMMTVGLIRGLGANLSLESKNDFAKQIFQMTGTQMIDTSNPINVSYDPKYGGFSSYGNEQRDDLQSDDFFQSSSLPIIATSAVLRGSDIIHVWLSDPFHKEPFIISGPDGCGKGGMVKHALSKLKSTSVAILHCSAQTTPENVLQKLNQACMIVTGSSGRVFKPKESEYLILYLKDLNLPKPDKYGTTMLISFLQQLITYKGFYDKNLEFVTLDHIQIVATMNSVVTVGRHEISTRLTSIMKLYNIDYPDTIELQCIYGNFLSPVLNSVSSGDSAWSNAKANELASTCISVYNKIRDTFNVDMFSHYQFTPRDLSRWILALLRYDTKSVKSSNITESVLEIVAYEACRIFRDRLVNDEDKKTFDNILTECLQSDWNSNAASNDGFFVTWSGSERKVKGKTSSKAIGGKTLGKLSRKDMTPFLKKCFKRYHSEYREMNIYEIDELIENLSKFDRVLTASNGSMLLAGRSGVGRRLATSLIAVMHDIDIFYPKIGRNYTLKHFRQDLKQILQMAGIEGKQIILMMEDYQIIENGILEHINSLLSAGEIPGLYNNDELDSIIGQLRNDASEDNFRGTMAQYFANRIQKNLHIVLILDYADSNFSYYCESNPALFKECNIIWLDNWSSKTYGQLPPMIYSSVAEEMEEKSFPDLEKYVQLILSKLPSTVHTSRAFLLFMETFLKIYEEKKKRLVLRRQQVSDGVNKLEEASKQVEILSAEAGKKKKIVTEKQKDADNALKEITKVMASASTQKSEVEKLKEDTSARRLEIQKRKNEVSKQLHKVQPMIDEANAAVSGIKPESLSELRALRAPPETIQNILEAVLTLLGQTDTTWQAMKNFLGKRGVIDDICKYDPKKISGSGRDKVNKFIKSHQKSFDPVNAKRASIAAAPLATWVQACLNFSAIFEKVAPLEKEAHKLESDLSGAEKKVNSLENELSEVDQKIAELRDKFEKYTADATEVKIELKKATDIMSAAKKLVSKLDGEYKRWNEQVKTFTEQINDLPKSCLLSAAFIVYLPGESEDVREEHLHYWSSKLRVKKFDFKYFMSSESEQLIWKSEGLPSDELSIQNAIVILNTMQNPFLIDPSSRATQWLKNHLANEKVEIVNQQDSNFVNSLELSVRFGKMLIVQEVDGIEPIIVPLMKKELLMQGTRYIVQVGEKTIDFNMDFKMYLATRNPQPDVEPSSDAITTQVNFTTTRAGLTGQLLGTIIQHEKPELEKQKTDLLQKEEKMKLEIAKLEDSLLEELANSTGNILENKPLLESLDKTKTSAEKIMKALNESEKLSKSIEKEREVYRPLAEYGSQLYFVVNGLYKVNAIS
ncbi:hypothetical protein SNEBB_000072 [Seison nebaliae]|nr:hypothetical protein SNEBB_000072 [Seison nebaliae]